MAELMHNLQPGTTLQNEKYRILRTLGQGGFGITYLAEQTLLDRHVAIKEFFFKEYCDRNQETSYVTMGTQANRELVDRFQKKFIKEARTICRLCHPNIIEIFDIFEENGTAYYVMEFVEGESLGDIVKKYGALPEAVALKYTKDVASALTFIHSNHINHLDIKPANLMLRSKDGSVAVIDFGVSKQYDGKTSEGTTTTPVGISHGYSPLEQYRKNGVQTFTPQSDVYALAATLYKLLTAQTPPEAIDVQTEGLPLESLREHHVSEHVIAAIVHAMKSHKERTQSIEAFVQELESGVTATAFVSTTTATAEENDEATRIITTQLKKEKPVRPQSNQVAPAATSTAQKPVGTPADKANASTTVNGKSASKRTGMIAAAVAAVAVLGVSAFFMLRTSESLSPEEQFMKDSTKYVQKVQRLDMDKLSEEEIANLQAEWDSIINRRNRELCGPKKKASEEFMAKIAKQGDVKKLDGGVYYKVIKEGDGPIPTADQVVTVEYEGRLVDGTVFDSTREHGDQPVEFMANQVIPGWTEALTHMPVGSEWEVYIPYDQAYGEHESGPIPPYSALIFKIKLLHIKQSLLHVN